MIKSILSSLCVVVLCVCYGARLSVRDGVDDVDNKYPYVVSFVRPEQEAFFNIRKHHIPYGTLMYRTCSGSLITESWVLSAHHCGGPTVRYGDMTLPPNASNINTSKVLKRVEVPEKMTFNIRVSVNDIALFLVEKVLLGKYARISAFDYPALMGRAVNYAGFGMTFYNNMTKAEKINRIIQDKSRPLQIGEGVLVKCHLHEMEFMGGFCVAPKCSKRHQSPYYGDSGGPILFDGKIVGVGSKLDFLPLLRYAAVSPYLDWIHRVVTTEQPDKYRADNRNILRSNRTNEVMYNKPVRTRHRRYRPAPIL